MSVYVLLCVCVDLHSYNCLVSGCLEWCRECKNAHAVAMLVMVDIEMEVRPTA